MAIVLQTVSDSKQAQADLAKLRASVDSIQQSTDKVSKNLMDFGKAFLIGGAVVEGVKAFVEYSDVLSNMENRIRVVTDSQKDFNAAMANIKQIAISTRNDLASVSSLYAKMSLNAKEMHASQAQIASVVKSVSQSLVESGASAQEARGAILNFGQAMAAGKLQGQDFRAVLEDAPVLANQIAKGLGVSLGQLYQMREQGTLFSSQVMKALIKQSGEIDANFSKMHVTYGQAFQNLHNSFVLLFSAVKNTFLSSSGAIPDMINNWAKSIASFANLFHYHVWSMKADILLFADDSVLLFKGMWDAIGDLGSKAYSGFVGVVSKFNPTLAAGITGMVGSAKAGITSLPALYMKVMGDIKKVGLLPGLLLNAKAMVTSLGAIFSKVGTAIKAVDVNKFLPGLEPALKYVAKWATAVERWFFWIWDKVIGHSWIPDLVDDTHSWLSKLSDGPLKAVMVFARAVSSVFEQMANYIGSVFESIFDKFTGNKSAALKNLPTTPKAPNSVAAKTNDLTASKQAAAILTTNQTIATQLRVQNQKQGPTIMERIGGLMNPIVSLFNHSAVGHFSKQFLGMRDRTPGMLFGERIDTGNYVARGMSRDMKYRIPLHDQIAALPATWQLPTAAAITGLFSLGIMGAFKQGPVRTAAMFAITTWFGLTLAKTIDPKTWKPQMESLAFFFMKTMRQGLDKLFNGNVANHDPLGLLALVAKIALLFKTGREFFGKGALNVATSPTKAILAANDMVDVSKLGKQIGRLDDKLRLSFPDGKKLETELKTATDKYSKALETVARKWDRNGNPIGMDRAQRLLNNPNGMDASRVSNAARQAINSALPRKQDYDTALAAFNARKGVEDDRAGVIATRTSLSKRLDEHRTALKEGFTNLTTGAGAIVGTAAGYQIGEQIAEGMEKSPAWVKIAVTMSGALLGQGIGAFIGTTASKVILLGFSGLGSLLTKGLTPVFVGLGTTFTAAVEVAIPAIMAGLPVIIGAAILAAIVIFRKQIFDPAWWEQMGQAFLRGVKNIGKAVTDWEERRNAKSRAEADAAYTAEEKRRGVSIARPGSVGGEGGDPVTADFINKNLGPRKPDADKSSDSFNFSGFMEKFKGFKIGNQTLGDLYSNFMKGPEGLKPDAGKGGKPPAGAPPTTVADTQEPAGYYQGLLQHGKDATASARQIIQGIDKYSTDATKELSERTAEATSTLSKFSSEAVDSVNGTVQDAQSAIAKSTDEHQSSIGKFVVDKAVQAKTAITNFASSDEVKGVANAAKDAISKVAAAKTQSDKVAASISSASAKDADKSLTPEDFKSLPPEFQDRITDALDKVAKLTAANKQLTPGSYLYQQNDSAIKEGKDVLDELVQMARFQTGKVSADGLVNKITNNTEPKLKVGETWTMVNEALPDLELTEKEFKEMSEKARSDIIRFAFGIHESSKLLADLPLMGTPPKKITQLQDAIDAKQRQAYRVLGGDEMYQGALTKERTPFASFKHTLAQSGFSGLDENLYNMLDGKTRAGVVGNIKRAAGDAEKSQRAVALGLRPEDLKLLAEDFAMATHLAQQFLDDFQKDIGKSKISAVVGHLDEAGVGIGLDKLVYFANAQIDSLDESARLIRTIQRRLDTEDLDPTVRRGLVKQKDEETDKLEMAKAIASRSDMSKAAGKALADSINETLTSGVSDWIKGKKSFKSMIAGMMDKVSNDLIDSFVNSFFEPLTGQSSKFHKNVSDMGEALFPFGRTDQKDVDGGKFMDGIQSGLDWTGNFMKKSSDTVSSWFSRKSKDPTDLAGNMLDMSWMKASTPPGFPTDFTPDSEANGGIDGSLHLGGIDNVASDFKDASKDLSGGLNFMPKLADSMNSTMPALTKTLDGLVSPSGGGLGGAASVAGSGGGLGGLLGGIGGMFSKGLSGIMDMFKGGGAGMWGMLGGLFGHLIGGAFAEGGLISGPGTGTSDSILARVSNKEFITNADATRKNLPLLHAINDGKFSLQSLSNLPKFADGGLVGASLIPVSAPDRGYVNDRHIPSKSSGNNTNIHLQVVGDVSKQTKATIIQMLPDIANGVNAHNREKGYKN